MTNPNVDMLFVMKRIDGSFNVEMVFPLKGIPCMLVRHHHAAFSLPPVLGQMSKIQRKKDMKFFQQRSKKFTSLFPCFVSMEFH